MPARKSTLKINKQGVAVNADIRTSKLDSNSVTSTPDIIERDAKSGELVTRQTYNKATGEPLEEGYGYRYVNESGEEVPKEDVKHYQIVDGEEQEFSFYEPTLGGSRTVTPHTWIPVDKIDEYLIDRTYEIWGEEDIDEAQLYELAELIREYGEAPVIEVVFQKSKYKNWGIITPQFFDDSFSMICRITREKIEPEHRMAKLTTEELEEKTDEEEEAPKLEQDSPF